MIVAWPFAGRDELLSKCGSFVGAPGTHAILLVGQAGIGKTRLLDECASRAERTGFAVLRAVAHRSSAAIPFGALAPLLPSGRDMVASGVPLLRQAGEALSSSASGRPILLAVDDAHLLDDASSVLIHQLVATRRVFVIATVQADVAAPDAVAGLGAHGLGVRIDVGPFDRAQIEAVLALALGGVVAAKTVDTLTRSSGGNPMALRELVQGSLDAGRLVPERGLWVLKGSLVATPSLRELVEQRVSGLDDDQRRTLQLLAVGDPLGAADAVALGATGLEQLEADGLVTVAIDGRRTTVALAQAAHRDTLLQSLPILRGNEIRVSIAQRVMEVGARRRGDEMRLSLFLLDSAAVPPRDVLVNAAHEAFFANDLIAAERLARAAEAIEHSSSVGNLLDAIMYRLGRAEAAINPQSVGTESERALSALNRAVVLYWHQGDRPAADEVLRSHTEGQPSSPWRDELVATRANFDVNAGYATLAIERLKGEPATSGRAGAVSALAYSLALPHVGRAQQALGWVEVGRRIHRDLNNAVMMFQLNLLSSTESTCFFELGHLNVATTVATDGYSASTRGHDTAGQAFNALVLGRVLVARGLLISALRWFREALVLFDAIGHRGPARWALGGIAMAAAMQGDVEVARTAIARLDSEELHAAQMVDADIARARAWTEMMSGNPVAARSLLTESHAWCEERGLAALEVAVLHDLARLGVGGFGVVRMLEVAASAEGSWLPTLAADAAARVNGGVEDLATSSDELGRLGANLLAAETAIRTADAHAASGRQRDATAWRRRALELLAECEGAKTPGIAQSDAPVPLTAREREIALLAATGLSSKAISGRLFLSARTVDNNLARVFSKLGIADRTDIARSLQLG